MDPRPDINETLLWGQPGSVAPKLRPKLGNKTRHWLARLLQVIAFGYLIYMTWNYFSRYGGDLEQIKDSWVSILIATALLAMGFVSTKFMGGRKSSRPPEGLPIWLSEQRLVYRPEDVAHSVTLPLEAIKTVHLDYVRGSRTLHLCTAAETLNLLSSDAEVIQRHLLSLRPELETTP